MHLVFETQRRGASGERTTFELPPGSGQNFEVISDPPGGFLIDVAALGDPDLPPAKKLRLVGDGLDMVLVPESRERFEAAFRSNDPNLNITLQEAIQVLVKLVSEVYVGRPTEPAAASSGSPQQTGPFTTPNGQSPGSTPSPPQPAVSSI